MILIADCGSTKTDWCLLNGKEKEAQVFTQGMNALMLSEDEMANIIAKELMPHISAEDVTEVYYYGAGCISADICGSVERAIRRNMPEATTVEVNTDLLAAARAVCGKKPGIACIMGTGSNSAYYDGNEIVKSIPAGGFIIGDEGSGAVLGKTLIADYIKNQMPENILAEFKKFYNGTYLDVVNHVYKQPFPNRWLANFTKFMYEKREDDYIHNMIVNSFTLFFNRNIKQFDSWKDMEVGFVGSIAYYFEKELKEAAQKCEITVSEIYQNPIEGLIEYHSK